MGNVTQDSAPGALRPVVRLRLYEQLVDRIIEHIRAEEMETGSRLPSERVLAQALGVSRNTLKQALLVLEVQGIIEVRHGGGMYLARPVDAVETLAALVDRRGRLPDVLDAREAVETKLAELAARRRTEADLAALDSALRTMEEEVEQGADASEGDELFHAALVAAAHSPILAGLYGQIAGMIKESRLESLRQPGRPVKSLAQHQRIADAVRAGKSAEAARAARRHVETVRRVRLLDWVPEDD
ncbi:MAG TPA: FadR/GntR family transcriptional regulator [Acidimicrobiales bacterium]|nr:FadR/GntR family transcriptional regulator [Acidimicrobiales bacterium]